MGRGGGRGAGCDRRGGLASAAFRTFSVGAAGRDDGRAVDVVEWPGQRADIFSKRQPGGVLLERRARGQLRHLREDRRNIGRNTTDDRSGSGYASRLVARREGDRVSSRPPRRRHERLLRPPGGWQRAEAVRLPPWRWSIGAYRLVAGSTLDRRQT